MTTLPASFQGDDDLDLEPIFERWWANEVHPTVKPSVHSKTTHVAFAASLLKMLRDQAVSEG